MSERIPITAVVLCHNELQNLPRCLGALARCAEVVVIDDGSDDGSRELARQLGARVETHPFTSFADQRNWAMDAARPACAWVLHLDADEVVTPDMLREIQGALPGMNADTVGWFARKTMLGERWLRFSAAYPVYVPRLLHREGPRFAMRGHGEWVAVEEASRRRLFANPMVHYNFSKGWGDWRERHNRYSAAEARRIVAGIPRVSLRAVVARDPTVRRAALRALSYRIPGRPFLRFFHGYFLRLGFLDGRAGFDFCLAMAAYEHMIDLKVREAAR